MFGIPLLLFQFRAHAEGPDVRSELEILHNSGSTGRAIRFSTSRKCTTRALAREMPHDYPQKNPGCQAKDERGMTRIA
jgi:hypothetical protein